MNNQPFCPSCSQNDAVEILALLAMLTPNDIDSLDLPNSKKEALKNRNFAQFAPPPKPVDPGLASTLFGLFCAGSAAVSGIWTYIFAMTKAASTLDSGEAFSSWLFWVLPGIAISFFLTGLIYLFSNLIRKSVYEKITFPRYLSAMAIYRDAYVCERCGLFFLSATDEVMNFSEFREFISTLSTKIYSPSKP